MKKLKNFWTPFTGHLLLFLACATGAVTACNPHELCDITEVWGKPEINCISRDTYQLRVYFTGVYIAHQGMLEKVVIDHDITLRDIPYQFEREDGTRQIFSFSVTVSNRGKQNAEVFFAIQDGHCTWTEPDLYDEPDCTP